MDLKLKGKTALVTASSDGLGLACALELSREGAQVILTSRDEKKLNDAAGKVFAQSGQRPLLVTVDLRDASSVGQLTAWLKARSIDVDILVYNVGGPDPGTFDGLSEEAWTASYVDNLLSYRALLKFALPHMFGKRWGRVISIASVSAKQSLEGLTISNTFRPAVTGLTKSLSREYGQSGVTFNTVCPGGIHTGRIDRVLRKRSEDTGASFEQISRSYVTEIPMKRLGLPEEVSAAVVFLASERASFINGVSLSVDGGLTRTIN